MKRFLTIVFLGAFLSGSPAFAASSWTTVSNLSSTPDLGRLSECDYRLVLRTYHPLLNQWVEIYLKGAEKTQVKDSQGKVMVRTVKFPVSTENLSLLEITGSTQPFGVTTVHSNSLATTLSQTHFSAAFADRQSHISISNSSIHSDISALVLQQTSFGSTGWYTGTDHALAGDRFTLEKRCD